MKKREINEEQLAKNMEVLPELCYTLVEDFMGDQGTHVGIIKRGVSGYFPYQHGLENMTAKAAKDFCDRQNERLGLTPQEVKAMSFGSMFGWDTPGAHPDAVINQERQPA